MGELPWAAGQIKDAFNTVTFNAVPQIAGFFDAAKDMREQEQREKAGVEASLDAAEKMSAAREQVRTALNANDWDAATEGAELYVEALKESVHGMQENGVGAMFLAKGMQEIAQAEEDLAVIRARAATLALNWVSLSVGRMIGAPMPSTLNRSWFSPDSFLTRTMFVSRPEPSWWLPFKHLRKTGAQLVRQASDGEIAGVFLSHGQPVASDELADVYSNRPFARVAEALAKVHAVLAPMFAAAPKAFTVRAIGRGPQRQAAD